jgi:hypothetical protein
MRIEYPVKVIIAWGEAISGNAKIREWLIGNGYPELGLFVHALYNQQNARQWLLENGYPHLMALINGAEGIQHAVTWLDKAGLDILAQMAKAADNDDDAMGWLRRHPQREWFIVAQKIRTVKNDIEFDNNDVHKISKD